MSIYMSTSEKLRELGRKMTANWNEWAWSPPPLIMSPDQGHDFHKRFDPPDEWTAQLPRGRANPIIPISQGQAFDLMLMMESRWMPTRRTATPSW